MTRSIRFSCCVALAVFLAALAGPSSATTIHVPADQPTIQAGIDAAAYGDTVLVACGTYYEHDIIMKSGVCLTSETGQADCVTIDAQELGRVMICEYLDKTTAVEGFTLAHGYTETSGGGVRNGHSSTRFTNCTFLENEALGHNYWGSGGGGMLCFGSPSPELTDCAFVGNTTELDSFFEPVGGGLMVNLDASPTLVNCVFSGNASEEGGGMAGRGMLTGCLFSGNEATAGRGGGLLSSGVVELVGCTFSGNTAGGSGGGMHAGAPVSLASCTFVGNSGGGISCYGSHTITITNTIIAFSEGAAILCGWGIPPLSRLL